MAVMLRCPDDATLLRLFGQPGSREEMEGLARHVEQCTQCGERIDEMLRKNELSLGLAAPADKAGEPDSEALMNLRRRLELLRPAAPSDKTTDAVGVHSTSASGSPFPATLPMSGADHGITFLAPPQEADEIGRLGTYRVLKKLGAGGMGMVLLAEDAMLKRKVALKVMLPSVAVNPQARERFLREARAAAAIEHPHIITIHQVGEDNGVPFLAMPLLKGESLDDRLRREKKLPINEAVRITCEMADGLAAAHAQGLIHRDIKPGNVWLEEQPLRAPTAGAQAAPPARRPAKVKVLDFGLARSQTDEVHLTQSGAIVGTPAFMAPEQARGLHVDARADLFSLGCVLYVMLTGRRPFTGESTMALLSSLALDTPKPPREINPAVPAVLSDFTMRLLAKKPEGRPASADAALDELRGMIRAAAVARKAAPSQSADTKTLVQSPTSQLAPRPAKAATRPPRRRVALLVGLALLFLIGGGFAAYQLLFKTNDGTLIVDVDDDAKVSFQKGELQIMGADGKSTYTLKPSEKNKTLPPGKYLIEVAGVDGLKMETERFEIIRDGTAKVRVTVDAAAVAKSNDAEARAAGWTPLFNGKDTQGWHESEGTKASWRVTGGTLIGSGEFGYLVTDRPDFENFRLRIEAKLGAGADSGLCFRVQDKHVEFNYEAQIGAGKPGMANTVSLVAFGKFGAGTLAYAPQAVPPGQWFTMEVLAEDNRFTIWVDGKQTVQYEDKERRYVRGAIALQQLGKNGEASFRKVEIKELPATKPDADPDRRAAEWVLSVGSEGMLRVNDKERPFNGEQGLPEEKFFVTYVGFWDNKQVTADGLKNLAGLTQIDRFDIRGAPGLGKATEVIGSWTTLRHLQLSGMMLTDEEFKPIRKLSNLTDLVLVWTSMTDAALDDLEQLTNLSSLTIGRTSIPMAKLAQLKNIKNLERLRFQGISDADLVQFKNMPQLTRLQLLESINTGRGLASLKTMPMLNHLEIIGGPMTDADLDQLISNKQLTELVIKGTKVTADGVKKLAAVLPKCKIEWDGGVIEPKP